MTKRVVISGYYGFDNLGDEAVLQSIIHALRSEDSDLEITVLSKTPEKTAASYGVKAKDRWKLSEVFTALKEADLLISGGGSLLQDVTSQMTIPYYLGVVGMARTLGKKVAFYAQGIGPIEKPVGRALTRLVANKVQLITVRDQESFDLLQEIGVKRPRIEVMVDPVVLLQPSTPDTPQYQKMCELKDSCAKKGVPLIGIAPRPWKGLDNFQKSLIETIERLQSTKQAEIVLIPMHSELDLAFCREISQSLSGVHILEGQHQPGELLAFYQQLDLLIGIRLHALIYAAVAHVPLIGISYDPKIDSFLKQIDQQAVAKVTDLKAESLYAEVINLLENKAERTQQIITHINKLQNKARDNAKMILELLN